MKEKNKLTDITEEELQQIEAKRPIHRLDRPIEGVGGWEKRFDEQFMPKKSNSYSRPDIAELIKEPMIEYAGSVKKFIHSLLRAQAEEMEGRCREKAHEMDWGGFVQAVLLDDIINILRGK